MADYFVWIILFLVSIPVAFNLVSQNRFGANPFTGWALMLAAAVGTIITFLFHAAVQKWVGTLFLVLVLLAIATSWIFGRFVNRTRTHRGSASDD